jgi:polar amino acid transport system substrate-binding protein
MKTRREFSASLVAGAAALALPSMGWAEAAGDITKRRKVLVAIDTSNPPYGTLNASMEADGYDVQVAKLLAKKLGVPLQIVAVTAQTRISSLLSGRADFVISTLTITPERALQVDFSQPYCTAGFVMVAPKEVKIATREDLAGKKVAVIRNGAADPLITAAAQANTTILRFDDDAGINQALMTNKVDAIATGLLVAAQLNKLGSGKTYENKLMLSKAEFGIAMRPKQPELQAWANEFVAGLKSSGELDAVSVKYLGVKQSDIA